MKYLVNLQFSHSILWWFHEKNPNYFEFNCHWKKLGKKNRETVCCEQFFHYPTAFSRIFVQVLNSQIWSKFAKFHQILFTLQATDKTRLDLETKLSETYQTLGEVSIENENYPQAIEDLTMCLRRRQDLLPEDSRCIAETHYQLGVALGFNAQFDEAVNALSDAIGVLEKRIGLLKESKESQGNTLNFLIILFISSFCLHFRLKNLLAFHFVYFFDF